MKGGIVIGGWGYWFNDYSSYSAGVNYAWRAPVSGDVMGSFSQFQTIGSANSWMEALVLGGRLYLVDMYGGNTYWAAINNDGSYGGWTNIGGLTGDVRHGGLVRVGNWVYRIGGMNDAYGIARAPIGNGDTLGSFSRYGLMPDNFYGASAVVVGKYLYAMASQANSWCRAEIDADGNLGGWVLQAGGMPNTEYHADRSWVQGDYVYFFSRYGLAQNLIID
jgi:hypothetical protein